MRHRAVASRAGLPLASTTYYSRRWIDLVEPPTTSARWQSCAAAGGSRSCPDDAVDRRLLSTSRWICWGGPTGERISEQPISRYERFIACARQPALREIQRGCCTSVAAAEEALSRSDGASGQKWSRRWSMRWSTGGGRRAG